MECLKTLPLDQLFLFQVVLWILTFDTRELLKAIGFWPCICCTIDGSLSFIHPVFLIRMTASVSWPGLGSWASEGGAFVSGQSSSFVIFRILKIWAKKVVFLISTGKKQISPPLAPLEKSPSAPPRKKSFRRPCLGSSKLSKKIRIFIRGPTLLTWN